MLPSRDSIGTAYADINIKETDSDNGQLPMDVLLTEV